MTFTLKRLYVRLRRDIKNFFNLHDSTDIDFTIKSIVSNIYLKGANIWILICSAILASLGLDINSVAVIIGAMLISPLMSPILGIGLGIGINDQDLLKKSFESFGLAVILSLITSTFYFIITPLGTMTPEIAARTSPTLIDAGIATFGGLAGIIAVSRREIPNTVPGVAIATALMPPLCTSGFGIAAGNINIFLGAFYLFFLNAVLISLTTYFMVRLLKFPYKEFVDTETKTRVHRGIIILVIIMLLPGAIILFNVIKEIDTKNKIKNFIEKNIASHSNEILRWETVDLDTSAIVKIYIRGSGFTDESLSRIQNGIKKIKENYSIRIVQLNLTESEKEELMSAAAFHTLQTIEINQRQKKVKTDKDKYQDYLFLVDSIITNSDRILKTLFPEIESVNYSLNSNSDTIYTFKKPDIKILLAKNLNRNKRKDIFQRVTNYFESQLPDTIRSATIILE